MATVKLRGSLVYDECKAQGESGESLKGKDVGHGLHTLDSWNVGKEQKAKDPPLT